MLRYNWLIAQEGTLPLRPLGRMTAVEHRPTVTLLWREGADISADTAMWVDPYFTLGGYQASLTTLASKDIDFKDTGSYFVTHPHYDHLLNLPPSASHIPFLERQTPLEGIRVVHCPGHHRELRALVFTSTQDEQVWVVSDAVLDDEWLGAWRYYYPNVYSYDEILQTWRSIAQIFAEADLIVPGHGAAIRVTPTLLEHLITTFPNAEFASFCPDVLEALQLRLAKMR